MLKAFYFFFLKNNWEFCVTTKVEELAQNKSAYLLCQKEFKSNPFGKAGSLHISLILVSFKTFKMMKLELISSPLF